MIEKIISKIVNYIMLKIVDFKIFTTLVEQIRAGSNSCDFENSHELEPHELKPAQILTRTNFGKISSACTTPNHRPHYAN